MSADAGGEGVVDLHGSLLRVSLALVPDARVGDWVLVHAGFALQEVSEADVEETWAVVADLRRASESVDPGVGTRGLGRRENVCLLGTGGETAPRQAGDPSARGRAEQGAS